MTSLIPTKWERKEEQYKYTNITTTFLFLLILLLRPLLLVFFTYLQYSRKIKMPQWKRRVAEFDWIRIERIKGKSKVGESQRKSGKAVEVVYEHVVPSEE